MTNGTGPLQDSLDHLGCGIEQFTGHPPDGRRDFGVTTPCAVAFGTNNNQFNTEQLYTVRVDYNISNNQKLFVPPQPRLGRSGHRHQPDQPAVQLC